MIRHTPPPSSSSGSPLTRASLSPSSSSICSLDTSSSILSFLSNPSRSPSPLAFPSSTSGYGSYPFRHHISLVSDSTSTRANASDVVHTGTGGQIAASPAGSYGSYRGTNTTSSLDDGSGSGWASGVSSGVMGSESSRVSERLSERSRVTGMVESRGYGAQYGVEDESRGDLPVQRRREGVSGQGEGGHGQGRGASHAHSTSVSTVTGSPPQPREGSSGAPMGGVFPVSGFGSDSGYQAQPGYSVQPSHPHYRFAQQRTQAPAHMQPSQGRYQYDVPSAPHATPASGPANPHGRSEFQAQSQQMAEPQGQVRTAVPGTRAPPLRTSTKRPRAPKRPRSDPSAGFVITPSRGNLVESDDESDDDEIVEWVPGLDDSGGPSGTFGSGPSGNAGTGEVGGTGRGTVQAAPGLPGGRKCVFHLSRCLFPPVLKHDVMLTSVLSFWFFSFIHSANVCTAPLIIPTALRLRRTTCSSLFVVIKHARLGRIFR